MVTHFADEFQRMRREDNRLKAYHVSVSYRGIFDILYVFTLCNQHEITDVSNKNKWIEIIDKVINKYPKISNTQEVLSFLKEQEVEN